MQVVKVLDITIGQGLPKICVPIVAADDDILKATLNSIIEARPDMVEFRGDLYSLYKDNKSLLGALEYIRTCLDKTGKGIPILFTLRTTNEGGNADVDVLEYFEICKSVCESGFADLIDIEAFMDERVLIDLCDIAHGNKLFVVASNHDFDKTPHEAEIYYRLKYMYEHGADISKIAVMPTCEEDVLSLLDSTLKYKRSVKAPVITMSMGNLGMISRLAGESFGSDVTFATVGVASAPGQLGIEDVRHILGLLHGND